MDSLYINRELSLLEFHKRVLAQAKDTNLPLLERLRGIMPDDIDLIQDLQGDPACPGS